MQPRRYVVRSGDTFWSITKHHYGNGSHWPELYAFNNQPGIVAATRTRIVDPNLIRPGQVLFLPSHRSTASVRRQPPGPASRSSATAPSLPQVQQDTRNYVPLPTPAGTAAPTPSLAPQSPGYAPSGGISGLRPSNPAADTTVNDFGYAYHLPDWPIATVRGVGFTATLKFKGVVFVQSTAHVPLIAYSNKGAEVQARHETTNALGQLMSAGKVAWDRKENKVTYECQMTVRANAHAPGTQLSAGLDDRGQPVLKATVAFPRFTGRLNDFVYVSSDFKVEIELKPDQDTQRLNPQPAPVPQRAPVPTRQPESNNGWIWGAALVTAAVVVVGATLIEDAVTEGAGIADDPASFALAARLAQMGRSAMTTQMTPALVPAM